VPTNPAAAAPTAAPTALLRSDLRLRPLPVPKSFSEFPSDGMEGLRIFDMSLLYPLLIFVGHNQTLLRRLQGIHYTQMRPHAAHHTPIFCWGGI
jgi:hypothetical protein